MFAKFVSATWGEETGAEAEDEVSLVSAELLAVADACVSVH